MAADETTQDAGPQADRDVRGWFLRTLKVGDRIILTGGIIIEMQKSSKGQHRVAICAPQEIRMVVKTG